MKKILMMACAAALSMSAVSCGNDSKTTNLSPEEQAKQDSLSNVITHSSARATGLQLNNSLKQAPAEEQAKLNKDDILRGIKYALQADTANNGFISGYFIGAQLLQNAMAQNGSVQYDLEKYYQEFAKAFIEDSVSMEEMGNLQQQHQMTLFAIQTERAEKAKKANTDAADAFLKNQKKADPSIQTSASGLSYKIAAPGEGAKATDNDQVKVRYTGKLVDGTVFDKNEEGVVFPVTGVVPGFSEGLKLLAKGGKATFYIPGNLGYGENGQPRAGIGPNAMLVFEVEVLDISPNSSQPSNPQQVKVQ